MMKKLNKRQLIIAWLMGIPFGLFYAYAVFMLSGPAAALKFMLSRTTIILIIGGLLIYILGDKEK